MQFKGKPTSLLSAALYVQLLDSSDLNNKWLVCTSFATLNFYKQKFKQMQS